MYIGAAVTPKSCSQAIRSPPENLPEVALIAAIRSFIVITNMPITEASPMGARACLSLAPCYLWPTLPLRAALYGNCAGMGKRLSAEQRNIPR